MESNEVYVLRQPEKTIMSVIVMDLEYPLTSTAHTYIDRLREISDTCFIFPSSSGINVKKFTSLYDGNCFIKCKNKDNVLSQVVKSLEYSLEIFEKHYSFLLFKLSSLVALGEEEFKTLGEHSMKINRSTLLRPILKIERLGSEDIYEYYKEENVIPENGILEKLMFWRKKQDLEENNNNMYTSWKTTSKVQFFRRNNVEMFIKFLSQHPGYLETFDGSEIDKLFASILRQSKEKIHNNSIENLNIGTV